MIPTSTANPLRLSCEVCRIHDADYNYDSADKFALEVSFEQKAAFSCGTLVEAIIRNTAAEDFWGVIHIKASIRQSNPKIFMPGYIYGHNTGEKPESGRKEFPRIREGACKRPVSTFWMTRSDRLAEPMSLVYDNGRVIGLAAAPYWVGDQNEKQEMNPQSNTDAPFYQYSGFTCRVNEQVSAPVSGHMSEQISTQSNGQVNAQISEQVHGQLFAQLNGQMSKQASAGYTLGYENAPWLFIQTATVLERAPLTEENAFLLRAGEEIRFLLRVYDYEATGETGIYEAIKDAYFTYHQPPRQIAGMDIRKATELLSSAIRDYAWLEDERMYTGFVFDTPEGFTYNKIGSLTWTNGMSVAAPMLLAANRLKDEEMRRQALTFMGEVIAHSKNPASGLLYDAVENGCWSVRGWWYDGMHSGGHSSYLNGQALYYLLKSYLSEKNDRNVIHDDWIDFASPVIAKLNTLKNTDGEYPFSMSEETGAGLEYDSLGGCWCLAACALHSRITGDTSGLEEMKRSEQYYYDTFVAKAECYGGPLDTDKAVDNEGILAFVRAARILHELTQEPKYLEHLRDGIYYETSFKLGYNTPVKVKPLCDISWSSCGGSITSTANPHIHPMSSTIVDEMFYLIKHTEDSYIHKRLVDTLHWGLQTFNTFDGEYGYGRTGWMSERFCFCQGLVTEKYPDGTPAGTWFALMPWASASIIEGFVGDAWEESEPS